MHRAPSMKTLQALHWLDDEKRQAVRRLIRHEALSTHYRSVCDWVTRCYNKPLWNEKVMVALNEVLETHGVEAIWHRGEVQATYCNAGDTYTPTIVYRYDTDTFSVGSWGDLVERHNWNGEQ